MKPKMNFAWLVILAVSLLFASCSKNYYAGGRKGSSCGCPSNPR